MVFANFLADIRIVPPWLKHSPDTGLTVIDVVAPAFILAIGLTYGSSFTRRKAAFGTGPAIGQFLRRSFALMGIGAVISAGEGLTGVSGRVIDWGVLQAIGAASLLTLPLIARPGWLRAAAGVALLAIYHVGTTLFFEDHVLTSSHGGIWGSVSWASMLMLASVFGDLLTRARDAHGPDERSDSGDRGSDGGQGGRVVLAGLLVAAGMATAGLLLSPAIPISKPRVSVSYVLVSLGISGSAFWLLEGVGRWRSVRLPVFAWWGRNPLTLYILHYFLLAIVVLPGLDWWHVGAPAWLVVVQALAILGCLSVVARVMVRRGMVLTM